MKVYSSANLQESRFPQKVSLQIVTTGDVPSQQKDANDTSNRVARKNFVLKGLWKKEDRTKGTLEWVDNQTRTGILCVPCYAPFLNHTNSFVSPISDFYHSIFLLIKLQNWSELIQSASEQKKQRRETDLSSRKNNGLVKRGLHSNDRSICTKHQHHREKSLVAFNKRLGMGLNCSSARH